MSEKKGRVVALAESLFVSMCSSGGEQYSVEHIAMQSIQRAEAFYAAADVYARPEKPAEKPADQGGDKPADDAEDAVEESAEAETKPAPKSRKK